MIELNELFKRSNEICIEIKKEDMMIFAEWLIKNDCTLSIADIYKNIKNDNFLLYMKIDISYNFNFIEFKTDDMWLYLFEDIKRDIVVAYHNNYAFFEDNPFIPDDRTYLRYGLEGVVVPKLNKPGSINKLFKGYNDNNEWNTPAIYYEGNGEESRELRKKFGTYDLSNKNHKAIVFANGEDVIDNKKAFKYLNELYCYEYRWVYADDGMPRILENNECFDSVLIPGNKHHIPLRIIIPDSFIETGLRINDIEYTRAYIFNEEHKQMIIKYCLIKHIEEVIMVENVGYPGNEYGRYLNINNNEYSDQYKVSYDKVHDNQSLYIDTKDLRTVGHVMFMILAAYANAHPELSELMNGKEFRFKI